MQQQLVDNYQRRFQYLRLSLTELCNFRCQYCLPNGYQSNKFQEFLTLNEIDNIANAFSDLGVKKIRLTGGEPTLRKDFSLIIERLAQYEAIEEIAVTTNGERLKTHVMQWQQAGLTALNVSIDSFSPTKFALITGQNKLNQVLDGVDKALEIGINKVKVNTVLMKGITDNLEEYLPWIQHRRVDLRFIELMETQEGATHFNRFHLSGMQIQQQLCEQGWQLIEQDPLSGPAKVYHHRDYLGKIGLIMPYSKNFCQSCNRLRISSKGKLHYCLFGDAAIELRDLLQKDEQKEALKTRILDAMRIKPANHFLHQHNTGTTKNLSIIGG